MLKVCTVVWPITLKFFQCFSIIVAEVEWILVFRILSDKMNHLLFTIFTALFSISMCIAV